MDERSTIVERNLLAAAQRQAPEGHVIEGPMERPPYWRCRTCGARYSNRHPATTLPLPTPADIQDQRPRRYAGFWWQTS